MTKSVSLSVLTLLGLAASYAWSADARNGLHQCTGIDSPGERLACYDKLAGRVSQPAAPSPSTSATASGERSPGTPATAAAQGPGAPSSTSATRPPPAFGSPAPGAATSEQPLPKESFGLYSSEHPTAPKGFPELTAAVTGIGHTSTNGSMSVTLEGGQVWRMADADPVLAKGDIVNIKRGKLGSFLMITPQGRTHRVARLK